MLRSRSYPDSRPGIFRRVRARGASLLRRTTGTLVQLFVILIALSTSAAHGNQWLPISRLSIVRHGLACAAGPAKGVAEATEAPLKHRVWLPIAFEGKHGADRTPTPHSSCVIEITRRPLQDVLQPLQQLARFDAEGRIRSKHTDYDRDGTQDHVETWSYQYGFLRRYEREILTPGVPGSYVDSINEYQYDEEGLLRSTKHGSFDEAGAPRYESQDTYTYSNGQLVSIAEWRNGSLDQTGQLHYAGTRPVKEEWYEPESTEPWLVYTYDWEGEQLVRIASIDNVYGGGERLFLLRYDSAGRLIYYGDGQDDGLWYGYEYSALGMTLQKRVEAFFTEWQVQYDYVSHGRLASLTQENQGFPWFRQDYRYSGDCSSLAPRAFPCVHPINCLFVPPETAILH